ncbi:c-type cytochrome [Henriciella litoralis]|uniref:c-type cytochrome n=1 Tax=Henriciella litoralis TaxID=568102 RepID=UPI000A065552|nr:cytochrome c family protein [Henriciella litoralis]
MKKTVVALAFVLAGGLVAACGGGESETPEAPEETSPSVPEKPEPGDVEQQPQAAEVEEEPQAAEVDVEENIELAGLPAPYNTADYERGRRVFLQCSSCHSIAEGGPTLIGPNLHGLFSRKVGSLEGYEYSKALQEADFEWTPEQLEKWLTRPRDFLPGNKMSFAGVQRPDDRASVIAYVMVESGYE